MALDRTWYNSLVDDDGSGLTGSVWDKADVDALMDAVDAELARIDSGATSGTFTPVLGSSGGGTPTYATQAGVWSRSGSAVTIGGRITLSSLGSLGAGSLTISGVPVVGVGSVGQALSIGFWAGVASSLMSMVCFIQGPTIYLYSTYSAGSPAAQALIVGNISGGFDVIFGGSYRV